MPEKSVLHPWLDTTEEAKFIKGEHGVTSDRWSEKPVLASCWKGAKRVWNIEDGSSYQSQLYCPFWKKWVNPSGFTCELCKKRTWPEIERYRVHILPALKDKEAQAAAILDAINRGRLTEVEAVTLGTEFELA